jgi:hypothetical protein
MSNALALLIQDELSHAKLQQIIVLSRACYDDDPLIYGLCYTVVLSLIELWEGDQGIDYERYQRIQALRQPLLDVLQTDRADSTRWIACLEALFRAWRQVIGF